MMKKFSLMLAMLLSMGLIGQANAVEYWLAGEDPVVQRDKHKSDPADYMDMFKPDAPWPTVASHLSGFYMSQQMGLRGTEDQIKTMLDGLKNRNIPLVAGLSELEWSKSCGGGEGYSSPLGVEVFAKRIKHLGGQIDYLDMDEPVFWGHTIEGKSRRGGNYVYCQFSIDDMSTMAASKIAILQRYFPNIKVGLTEPVNSKFPQLASDILEFADQIQQKTSIKLSFVHGDVAWWRDWRPQMGQLAMGLHSRGIKFGPICEGVAKEPSDEVWVDHALEHCQMAADDPQIAPDQFVIQTWVTQPTEMLPEDKPGTLTNEAKRAMAMFK